MKLLKRHASRLSKSVVLAVLASSAAWGDTTVTFQNGANGYAGAADFSINTQYAQYNGGNGLQWKGDPELGCYTTTGSGSYSARYLLKFGGLGVAPGTQVVSATLALDMPASATMSPASASSMG